MQQVWFRDRGQSSLEVLRMLWNFQSRHIGDIWDDSWGMRFIRRENCIQFLNWPFKAAVPTFLAPGTGFVEDNFSMGRGLDSSGGNASDGEWWGTEDLLARLPLTSCCVASFLTGRRWVPVRGLGGWGPLPYIVHSNYYICWVSLLLKLSKTPSIKEFIIQMLIPHPCLKKCGFEVYCMWLCSICKAINENIRSFFSL